MTVRADPGIGRESAPIGSRAWAERVRLHMQTLLKEPQKDAESFASYVRLCEEHRAWTLMNKPDGSFFKSFREFCEHKEPWGLGASEDEVKAIVEFAIGKRAADLMTVDPPRPGNQHTVASGPEVPKQNDDRVAKRLRAILRAPEEVQALYREGLMGQKEAAKLGPKKRAKESAEQAAERAATVAAVAHEAVAVARTSTPVNDRERRDLAKRVNETVRRRFGAPKLSADVRGVQLAIRRLTREEQAEVYAWLGKELAKP